DICNRGGRGSQWFRTLCVWHYFADYFPLKLLKTHDLDPGNNYLFIVHPHGVLIMSCIGNFVTQSTGFLNLFKGFNIRVVTLDINFWLPIHRDIFLFLEKFIKLLMYYCIYRTYSESSNQVVALVVGGGRESLDAKPNTMNLYLKNRKGFVKIALTTGTSLVPVLTFGENEIYDQIVFPSESRFRRFQEWLLNRYYYTLPVLKSYLPNRHPVITVVGKPISVAKVENPSSQQINELHNKYIDNLRQLFNENKDKYGLNELKLIIN
ncbi:unnamed protein product, partial [Medioppia subpectinata]